MFLGLDLEIKLLVFKFLVMSLLELLFIEELIMIGIFEVKGLFLICLIILKLFAFGIFKLVIIRLILFILVVGLNKCFNKVLLLIKFICLMFSLFKIICMVFKMFGELLVSKMYWLEWILESVFKLLCFLSLI